MNKQSNRFFQLVNNPFTFRMFLLTKMPAAFFCGIRIAEANAEKCVVTIPYKWFNQNPFNSIYFACLSMAAEMSTGVLAMAHIYKRIPAVSMLVVKMNSNFNKKATDKIFFTCYDGLIIKQAIEDAINANEGKIITARSFGQNKQGETIASFDITWSFKPKAGYCENLPASI